MLVDDEKDLLALTRRILEKEGRKVYAFTNPIKALSHVDGCKDCYLVISGTRMPGMSGFEFARRVKDMRPEMKVILMTAFKINKEEAKIVLPSVPVDAFIDKPFTSTELIQAVKQFCSITNA